MHDGAHNFRRHLSHGFGITPEKEGDQRREYVLNSLLAELRVANNVEVSNNAVGDESASSARGTHGGENDNIFKSHELQVLSVVPPFVV